MLLSDMHIGELLDSVQHFKSHHNKDLDVCYYIKAHNAQDVHYELGLHIRGKKWIHKEYNVKPDTQTSSHELQRTAVEGL